MTSKGLLNHVHVVVGRRIPVRRLLRALLRALPPAEVIRHLGVELLLRLPRASSSATTGILALALATTGLPPSSRPAAPLRRGAPGTNTAATAATGDVSIDALERSLFWSLQVTRREGTRPVVRHGDSLREGPAGHDSRVEGVATPAAVLLHEGEGDGLAVGIGPIELLDGGDSVVVMPERGKGDALRTAGAVVAEVEVR